MLYHYDLFKHMVAKILVGCVKIEVLIISHVRVALKGIVNIFQNNNHISGNHIYTKDPFFKT